jgi:chemotaxis protein CheD
MTRPFLLHGDPASNRYWDPVRMINVTRVEPGYFALARGAEVIQTRVGVGICVCARDPHVGIGGLAHFMLPSSERLEIRWDGTAVSALMRYGNVAMEYLVTAVCKAGGDRNRIELMVFGGARLAARLHEVAERHIAFIRAYAEAEKMQIVEQDLGDDYAREVAVYPGVGTVQVSVLADSAAQAILADEETHLTALESTAPTGEVILF